MSTNTHDLELGFASEQVNGRKRVAVITGANSGLGRETARQLLLAGMQIICACRNRHKGETAVRELLEETATRPNPSDDDAIFMALDVSSIGSVRTFAEAYESSGRPIHVLLCNAGIMMGPHRTSADGLELQMATNYVGHFELCRLLTDRLIRSAPARVVHVSSIAARRGQISLDHLNQSVTGYDSRTVYSMTKLLQVVFSRTLNHRLEGSGVTSNSIEPGIVATNLSQGITDNPSIRRRLEQGVSVEEGARTQVLLCGSNQVTGLGGGHWADCVNTTASVENWPAMAGAASRGFDIDAAVWQASEALIDRYAPSNT